MANNFFPEFRDTIKTNLSLHELGELLSKTPVSEGALKHKSTFEIKDQNLIIRKKNRNIIGLFRILDSEFVGTKINRGLHYTIRTAPIYKSAFYLTIIAFLFLFVFAFIINEHKIDGSIIGFSVACISYLIYEYYQITKDVKSLNLWIEENIKNYLGSVVEDGMKLKVLQKENNKINDGENHFR